MVNTLQKRNNDPQKISAEKINGRLFFLEVTALVRAYISTKQTILGIV